MKELDIFREKNSSEREMMLQELQKALCEYAIVGKKNSQLDYLTLVRDDFKMNMDSLITADATGQKKYGQAAEDLIVYYACIQQLYELQDQVENRRTQLEKFTVISEQNPDLDTLVKEIALKRYVNMEKAEELANGKLKYFLKTYSYFFNIRVIRQTRITLTYLGKLYVDYLCNIRGSFIRSNPAQDLVKSFHVLLDGISNSYQKKKLVKVKIQGLDPIAEKSVTYQYRRTVDQIIRSSEEIYLNSICEVIRDVESDEPRGTGGNDPEIYTAIVQPIKQCR